MRRSVAKVLEATLDELAERGFGAFTIDGVARRSGAARSTIYRLWADRESLIGEAMESLNRQPQPDDPGLADPRQRVVAIVSHLTNAMRTSKVAACLPALVDGAERDEAVRALHHGYNDRRRAALVAAVADARSAGRVASHVDPEMAATALAGAVVYRRLMTARSMQQQDVATLVNTVLGPDLEPAQAACRTSAC